MGRHAVETPAVHSRDLMTHLERMEVPMVVVLPDGDWDVVQGLVIAEWAHIRDSERERASYLDTLDRIRQTIINREKA